MRNILHLLGRNLPLWNCLIPRGNSLISLRNRLIPLWDSLIPLRNSLIPLRNSIGVYLRRYTILWHSLWGRDTLCRRVQSWMWTTLVHGWLGWWHPMVARGGWDLQGGETPLSNHCVMQTC